MNGLTQINAFVKGSMTGVRCADDILITYVQLFQHENDSEFRLMDCCAKPARAHPFDGFLESDNIRLADFSIRFFFPEPYCSNMGCSRNKNWISLFTSRNHSGSEKSIAGGVRLTPYMDPQIGG